MVAAKAEASVIFNGFFADLGSVKDQTSLKHTKGEISNLVFDAISLLLITFLHDVPPPLGPVAQLQSVALFYLCPLLEAADQLITQPVTVVYPLHCPFVVPRLQRNTTHTMIKEREVRY